MTGSIVRRFEHESFHARLLILFHRIKLGIKTSLLIPFAHRKIQKTLNTKKI